MKWKQLTPIRLRYTGKVLDMTTAYDDQDLTHTEPVDFNKEYISTTVGRVILNDALPAGMPYINGLLKKKGIGQLVNYCNQNLGLEVTVGMLDRIKELGFSYATRSGLSWVLDDMVIPASKYTTVKTKPTRRSSKSKSNTWTARSPTASVRTRSSRCGRPLPIRWPTKCSAT